MRSALPIAVAGLYAGVALALAAPLEASAPITSNDIFGYECDGVTPGPACPSFITLPAVSIESRPEFWNADGISDRLADFADSVERVHHIVKDILKEDECMSGEWVVCAYPKSAPVR